MIRLTSKADQDKNAEVLWARKWENWQNAKPIVCRVIGARPSENENKKVLVWLPSDFWIYPTALKKAYTLGSKIRLMELEKPGLSMCLCIIAPEGYVTFILPPVL
ncbi:hypothetical protein RND81_12G034300 [Saponaria officinalis]|uniref:Uncharacterized protein n=1 Tax=Saponaria officinalis TaxID=3572 RepID=A0AAW1H5L6_SAPOF